MHDIHRKKQARKLAKTIVKEAKLTASGLKGFLSITRAEYNLFVVTCILLYEAATIRTLSARNTLSPDIKSEVIDAVSTLIHIDSETPRIKMIRAKIHDSIQDAINSMHPPMTVFDGVRIGVAEFLANEYLGVSYTEAHRSMSNHPDYPRFNVVTYSNLADYISKVEL